MCSKAATWTFKWWAPADCRTHPCLLQTDKRFQLADWRVRPLSPQMLQYARADTHYLLHMYDVCKVSW